jgi:hypothetical protein
LIPFLPSLAAALSLILAIFAARNREAWPAWNSE